MPFTGIVARRHPEVDAVIVGVGWVGGLIAGDLVAAGLRVVALERGPDRPADSDDFVRKHDELKYRVRHALMQDVAQESWTFRHDLRESALPFRRLGAFMPGTGVGGAGAHYGGGAIRFAPWEFEARTRTIERYGAKALPEESLVQDWGVTYDDLEPHFDRFERMVGVSGKAGNLRGVLQPGGNPFEGPRSNEFAMPPSRHGEAGALMKEACLGLGYHPYPSPATILTRDWNVDGVERKACTYCGNCGFYACEVGARGDSRVTTLPAARRSDRFTLRADSRVIRILHDGRGTATGVLYQRADGTVEEQPAGVVVLGAYSLGNTRLLLLSGLGRPYDPVAGTGVVGRSYAYNVHANGQAFFRGRSFKKYIGAGGSTYQIADFAADNYDHSGVGFIGGAHIMMPASGGSGAPIEGTRVPPGSPTWGAGWKAAIKEWYDRSVSISGVGGVLAYRTNYLDLDPTYRDAWGDPLLRITFDWKPNELALAAHTEKKIHGLLEAMRPDHLATHANRGRFDTVPYQGTHNTGGAPMGADPSTSAVNPWLQMWDHQNVWVVGGSAFPQNGTPGPTGTICALALRASEGITRYVKRPGPLA